MKQTFTKLIAIGLCITLFAGMTSTSSHAMVKQPSVPIIEKNDTQQNTTYKNNEVIVGLKPGVSAKKLQTKDLKAIHSAIGDSKTGLVQLYRSDSRSTPQLLQTLQKNPNVVYAEPNYLTRSCKKSSSISSEKRTTSTLSSSVSGLSKSGENATRVWDDFPSQTGTKKTRVIALLDSGIDLNNEVLKQCLWTNPYPGILPGEHGYNIASDNCNIQDDEGEGTAHAQLIQTIASNQTSGIAHTPNIQFLPLKIYDDFEGGDEYTLLKALDYLSHAKKLGVDVIAAYFACELSSPSKALEEALNKLGKQGILSVIPTGTDFYFQFCLRSVTENTSDTFISHPAFFHSPYVIQAVPANEQGERLSQSYSDSDATNFAAPAGPFLLPTIEPCYQPQLVHSEDVIPDDQSADQSQEQNTTRSPAEDVTYFYRTFDQEEPFTYTMDAGGVVSSDKEILGYPSKITVFSASRIHNKNVQISVHHSKDEAFGNTGSSLKIEIDNMNEKNVALIAIPYLLPANQKKKSDVSLMLQLNNSQGSNWSAMDDYIFEDVDSDSLKDMLKQTTFSCTDDEAIRYMDSFYGKSEWEPAHFNISQNTEDFPQKRYLLLKLYGSKSGKRTIYLDNLGITKGLDEKEADFFDRADYFCDEQTAAAYTTAALALFAQAYPNADATKLRNLLRTSVKQTERLKAQTTSGGILDLNKSSTPVPVVDQTTYDTKGNLHIKGCGFLKGQTTVTINGKNISPSTVKENELILPAASYQNQTVSLTVTTPYGSNERQRYLTSGKSYPTIGNNAVWTGYTSINNLVDSKLLEDLSTKTDLYYDLTPDNSLLSQMLQTSDAPATDGTYFYFYNTINDSIDQIKISRNKKNSTVTGFSLKQHYMIIENTAEEEEDFDDDDEEEDIALNVDSNKTVDSDLIYIKKKLYFIMDEKEAHSVFHQRSLYALDLTKPAALPKKVIDMPSALKNTVDLTLANYNGTLYLLGGYDYTKKSLSKTVYCLNQNKKKTTWKKSVSLPEGRAKGCAVSIGKRLYYTLGVTKKGGSCPATLVFDGKKWKKLGSALSNVAVKSEKQYGSKTMDWYTGHVSAYQKQLVFSGLAVKTLGDTFTQSTANGKYKKINYNGQTDGTTHSFLGTVLGNDLVGFYSDGFHLYNSYVPLNEK
ncbi:MAG: hypothetical protein ACI4HI_03540 [Lachnospiraceae bacterium]